MERVIAAVEQRRLRRRLLQRLHLSKLSEQMQLLKRPSTLFQMQSQKPHPQPLQQLCPLGRMRKPQRLHLPHLSQRIKLLRHPSSLPQEGKQSLHRQPQQ